MSGGEVSKRNKEVRKNANTRMTDLKAMASDMDNASLGETSSEDEFQHDGRDGSYPRRWSSEEDARLRTAVDKYHEANWKEIALEVGTRNHVQCLQRWKKVLTPGLVKGQWSRKEDELLVSLVREGHKNWGALAAHVPGRTSKQCRERWCHHLDPRIVKGDWTEEEDRIILSMHEDIGNKWATIAQSLNGRTENATKIRWKILQRSMKHEEERQGSTHQPPRLSSGRHGTDERLRCLAAQAAASAMSKAKNSVQPIGMPENPEAVRDVLAQESMGRVDIQSLPDKRRSLQIQGKSPPCDFGNEELGYGNGCLKKRKLNGNEDPIFAGEEIDSARRKREANATVHGEGGGRTGRRGWLRDEDDRLKLAVDKLGDRSWRQVAEIVGTRTHIQCQQRWKKALRPGLIKGAWSVEEDENLMKLISKGFSNWTELASHTPGRTAKQCRERWCHHLDPSVNHGSWTEEEDQQLLGLQIRLGTKWSAIAREMPGRTEHAVKGRVKTLSRCQRVSNTGISKPSVDNMTLKKKPEERFGVRQRGIACSERHSVLPSFRAASGEMARENGVNAEAGQLPEASENSAMSSISLLAPLAPEKSIGANQSHSMILCATDPLLDRLSSASGAGFMQGQQQQLQLLPGYQQDSQVMRREDGTKPQTQLNANQCLSQLQDSTEKSLTSVLETGGRVGDCAGSIVTSDGISITKLLSLSSADTESFAGLAEESVTSGCCGGAIAAFHKTITPHETIATRGGYPCEERNGAIDSFRLPRQDGAPTAPIQRREKHRQKNLQDFAQPLSPPGSSTSRSVLQIATPSVAPFPHLPIVTAPITEDLKVPLMPAPSTHISSIASTAPSLDVPTLSAVSPSPGQDMSIATEASLLVNKPSEIDYSDLASFLTDSFDARQDGLGAGIERVSLGDDPYSDYYDNASCGAVNIVQCPTSVHETREGKMPTVLLGISREYGQGAALNTNLPPTGAWEESTEALVALGVTDVCDPYF